MKSEKTAALRHPAPRRSIWLRLVLLLALSLALAAAIATLSSDATYEDRLVDLTLRQVQPQPSQGLGWAGAAPTPENASALKALLVDFDHELAFKARLALEKYGPDAQDVLLRFGDDPTFHAVMRQYGENVVPVVAYFVKNDVASIRLLHVAQQKGEEAVAAAKGFWQKLWPSAPVTPAENAKDTEANTPPPQPTVYGPDLRGQRAIAFIDHEGHQFLGQFVLDPQGQAAWVQTERGLEAAKSFFFSGVTGLEKKYQRGQPLQAADVLSVGMDVLLVVGTFKAVKFLRAAKQVRAVGIVQRTQLLGAPLLRSGVLGRQVIKYGAIAGTAYLAVRYPSLISGMFVTAGQWLGVSPLLAKVLGWSVLLAPLLLPLLSFLVLALTSASTLLRITGHGLRWVRQRLSLR